MNNHAKSILAILGISVPLGIVYDWLFFDRAPGLSFPLFIALAVLSLLLFHRYILDRAPRPGALALLAPLAFFSAMVFVRDSLVLTVVNCLLSFYLLFLLVISLNGERIREMKISRYAAMIFEGPVRIFSAVGDYIEKLFKLPKLFPGNPNIVKAARGLAMSLPLIIIFLLLFSSADLVFRKHLTDLISFRMEKDAFPHLLVIIFISIVSAGLLNLLYSRAKFKWHLENDKNSKIKDAGFEIGIILSLLNIVFLSFIIIQITYLFGGQQNISIEGYTYSEYARKGFFELIAVALITFAVLWHSDKILLREPGTKTLFHKIIETALIAQIGVIMVSAFVRLNLYELSYGFTELRFYSHTFIIYIAAVYLVLAYKILFGERDNIFAITVFITTLTYAAALNLVNPEAFIVGQNIGRFDGTGKIDTYYIYSLSDDAIPPVLEYINSPDADPGLTNVMKGMLYRKIADMETSTEYSDWRSHNLSRFYMKNALLPQKDGLESFKKYGLHFNSSKG